jgi:PAS domain S-box-containing protein
MSLPGGIISSVWPPAGIAVAAIVLCGRSAILPLLAAALVTNYVMSNGQIFFTLMLSFANILEAMLGGKLIKRVNSFDWTFGTTQHVWGFLARNVTLTTLITPVIGSSALWLSGALPASNLTQTFFTWWLSHSLGVLIFTPFILVISRDALRVPFEKRELEYALLLILSAMTCVYLFVDISALDSMMPMVFRRIYILFPLTMWAAVRFGPIGLTFLMMGIAVMTTYGAAASSSMFLGAKSTETFIAAQLYLSVIASTGLLTASNVLESERSESKFRSMFEMSGVPAALVDVNGHFKLTNDQYCKMTGYSRSELLGMTFSELTHPEDREPNLEQFKRLIAGVEKNLHVEKRYVAKNGDIIWVIIDSAMIEQSVGEDVKVIAIAQDITKRKVAEMAAESAQKIADEANRAKTEFLAFMGHEIRTPLGVILGFAELLKNPVLDEKLRDDFTRTIHRNAVELGSLIDDMLDLSKVEAGRLELLREDVVIEDLMRDIRDTFTLEAELKDIHLEISIDSNVPHAVRTDHRRLRQILINIVGNAVKYTSSGHIKVKVGDVVLKSGQGPCLVFEVEDTGCGISSDELQQIFKPFGQAKRILAKKIRGTGLGLVLSKQLARLLGGDVVLKESKPNSGSTFQITIEALPIAQHLEVQGLKRVGEAQSGYQPLARLDGLSVLVAEDTPDQAMLINFLLTDLGARVEIVDNGAAAVEKTFKSSYDVILMDMRMPVLDGYDATRILRRDGYKRPIIALTAQALREEREKAMAAGCTSHLAKPFTQERLLGVIHSAISKESERPEVLMH